MIDRRNLDLIREEANFQLSGYVSDESAVSIGKQLGTQIIVTGSLQDMGKHYRFRIKAIHIESAQIVAQPSYNLRKDEQTAILLGWKSAPIASGPDDDAAAAQAEADAAAKAAAKAEAAAKAASAWKTVKYFLPHQIGIGTTFSTPILTVSVYNTGYALWVSDNTPYLFFDYGFDAGFIHGFIHGLIQDLGDVGYYSFYPNGPYRA